MATRTKKKTDEPKKPNGRPCIFTQELADAICEAIGSGKSLVTVCKEDNMPHPRSVYGWLRTNENFLHNYELAMKDRVQLFAEQLTAISDDGTNDYMEDEYMKGKTPGYVLVGENIQRSRLRVDTRKWLMSKMDPKRYGDKMDVTSAGKELPSPIISITKPTEGNASE